MTIIIITSLNLTYKYKKAFLRYISKNKQINKYVL